MDWVNVYKCIPFEPYHYSFLDGAKLHLNTNTKHKHCFIYDSAIEKIGGICVIFYIFYVNIIFG